MDFVPPVLQTKVATGGGGVLFSFFSLSDHSGV